MEAGEDCGAVDAVRREGERWPARFHSDLVIVDGGRAEVVEEDAKLRRVADRNVAHDGAGSSPRERLGERRCRLFTPFGDAPLEHGGGQIVDVDPNFLLISWR